MTVDMQEIVEYLEAQEEVQNGLTMGIAALAWLRDHNCSREFQDGFDAKVRALILGGEYSPLFFFVTALKPDDHTVVLDRYEGYHQLKLKRAITALQRDCALAAGVPPRPKFEQEDSAAHLAQAWHHRAALEHHQAAYEIGEILYAYEQTPPRRLSRRRRLLKRAEKRLSRLK